MSDLAKIVAEMRATKRETVHVSTVEGWMVRLQEIGSLRQVPEGWVLVPVIPTREMVFASNEVSCRDEGREHWAAMIAAAPKANPAPPTSGEYPAKFERHGSETTDAADLLTVSGYSEKYSAVFLDCDKFPPLSTVRVYAADATPTQTGASPSFEIIIKDGNWTGTYDEWRNRYNYAQAGAELSEIIDEALELMELHGMHGEREYQQLAAAHRSLARRGGS